MSLFNKIKAFLFPVKKNRVKDNSLFLAFDTETTGRKPSRDSIVQLAAILFDSSGKEIASMNHIIKPVGFLIPAENSKFHGITHERAVAEGKNLRSVLLEFLDLVLRSNYLVAHNFKFDFDFVWNELIRMGLTDEAQSAGFIIKESHCTMKSTSEFCKLNYLDERNGYKYPRLGELHKHLFGVGFHGAHNALNDVRAVVRCFVQLRNKHGFYTADWVKVSSGYSNRNYRNRKPRKSES